MGLDAWQWSHECGQHLPEQVADTDVEAVDPQFITGPVMGGNPADAAATKADLLPLPPSALPTV